MVSDYDWAGCAIGAITSTSFGNRKFKFTLPIIISISYFEWVGWHRSEIRYRTPQRLPILTAYGKGRQNKKYYCDTCMEEGPPVCCAKHHFIQPSNLSCSVSHRASLFRIGVRAAIVFQKVLLQLNWPQSNWHLSNSIQSDLHQKDLPRSDLHSKDPHSLDSP